MYRPFCFARPWLLGALVVAAASSAAQPGADAVRNDTGSSSAAAWRSPLLPPVSPVVVSPLVWSVVGPPVQPVRGTDGRLHLAYELFVINLSADPVRVHAVETVDPASGNRRVGVSSVTDIRDADVSGLVRRLASRNSSLTRADFTRRLQPGRSGVVYIDLRFDRLEDIPPLLAHRLTMSTLSTDSTPSAEALDASDAAVPADAITAIGAALRVLRREPIVLSPPLRGDRWLDASGCCRVISPHRYTLLPIAGTLHAPEHFAIDFVQLDDQGRAWVGDPKVLRNWLFYGAEVIAAGGGTVVQVRDGLPDQVPGKLPDDITADTAAGNHVIVDMGQGHHAMYAHLVPGSITVREGQHVARGEQLGRLGNSGNSDAPHLHFQVSNSASTLETAGLPFVFDRMELQGRLRGSLDRINEQIFAGRPPDVDRRGAGVRRRQMPLTNDLLGF